MNKFNTGDLVRAYKGLFNDEDKGGYGIVIEMGQTVSIVDRDIRKPWAMIQWTDGTRTRILEYTQAWDKTELIAKAKNL
jgi:hypothetical protein